MPASQCSSQCTLILHVFKHVFKHLFRINETILKSLQHVLCRVLPGSSGKLLNYFTIQCQWSGSGCSVNHVHAALASQSAALVLHALHRREMCTIRLLHEGSPVAFAFEWQKGSCENIGRALRFCRPQDLCTFSTPKAQVTEKTISCLLEIGLV